MTLWRILHICIYIYILILCKNRSGVLRGKYCLVAGCCGVDESCEDAVQIGDVYCGLNDDDFAKVTSIPEAAQNASSPWRNM